MYVCMYVYIYIYIYMSSEGTKGVPRKGSSRITTVIHVRITIKQTITVLMSHSQFRRIKAYTESRE